MYPSREYVPGCAGSEEYWSVLGGAGVIGAAEREDDIEIVILFLISVVAWHDEHKAKRCSVDGFFRGQLNDAWRNANEESTENVYQRSGG